MYHWQFKTDKYIICVVVVVEMENKKWNAAIKDWWVKVESKPAKAL